MGELIQFPNRGLATPVATVQSLSRAASGRWLSVWDVDDWGRDDTLARATAWLGRLRWETITTGLELLPESGPAVVVVNTRRFRLTQWWVALTLSAATGRPARFVGRSDVAPFGAVGRRLGGLLERPDEVAGALRDGQLLVVGLSGTLDSRRFRLTPWWVALTLSAATGRPVRFVGRSDVAPFGALARRLGGLLERPDEVAGALRDGQLLVLGLSGTLDSRRIGRCDPHALAPAVERNVPVFPAAVALSDISRSARIEIAPAIRPLRGRGPIGDVEIADVVEAKIGELLELSGGT
ncbi:MAG: hypothetical protein ABW122_15000 [Ilumatobacteraceae bacterium]